MPDRASFYNRVKGKMERDLTGTGLQRLVVLRPSLILGERIASAIMKLLSGLMIGSLRRYRPIEALVIAGTIVRMSLTQSSGRTILESERIQELGKD
jgi:uncharacterized protein YbjT (DUF2867 family)